MTTITIILLKAVFNIKRLYKYIWSCFPNIPQILITGGQSKS